MNNKRLEELLNNILDYAEGTLGQSEFSVFLFQTAELVRDDRIQPMLELLNALCKRGADVTALMEVLTQTVAQYPISPDALTEGQEE